MKFRSDIKVEYVQHMGSDEMIARAARVSTNKDTVDQEKIAGLIGYLAREGHCYDAETEILTRTRGWVLFRDLEEGEEVLARNEAGEMAWETPSEIIDEQYSGPMMHFTGRNLDLLVTPQHRMLAERRTSGGAGWKAPEIVLASEFQERSMRVLRGGGELRDGVDVPEWKAKLLGFIIADAHVGRTKISFNVRKRRKIRFLTQLVGDDLSVRKQGYGISLELDEDLTRLARETYATNGSRMIPPEVLKSWSGASIKNLLTGFLEGDGHRGEGNRVSASTVSAILAEQLQVAAILSGGTASIHGPFEYGTRSVETGWSKSFQPVYNVMFAAERHLRVRVGWTREAREKQVSVQQYRGRVYCVTVPSGVVMVRRNGKTLWSGNSSPFEHCVVTVRAEAPIFVAREWMRHRTQSYSEFSMRFSEAEPEFYIPPVVRPLVNDGSGAHPKLVDGIPFQTDISEMTHETAYKLAWDSYCRLVSYGVATEVARNVLPVGTYTKFYATANLNNWFKFLTLRDGKKGAPQWEIVRGAEQVASIIQELYPVAYAAFEKGRE